MFRYGYGDDIIRGPATMWDCRGQALQTPLVSAMGMFGCSLIAFLMVPGQLCERHVCGELGSNSSELPELEPDFAVRPEDEGIFLALGRLRASFSRTLIFALGNGDAASNTLRFAIEHRSISRFPESPVTHPGTFVHYCDRG